MLMAVDSRKGICMRFCTTTVSDFGPCDECGQSNREVKTIWFRLEKGTEFRLCLPCFSKFASQVMEASIAASMRAPEEYPPDEDDFDEDSV